MEETKYTIETTNSREANLMMNSGRMAGALYDILSWYRALYNGKDYDYKILYRGKLYTEQEFRKVEPPVEDLTEHGLIRPELITHVYTAETLEKKLRDLTDNISDLIFNYYE